MRRFIFQGYLGDNFFDRYQIGTVAVESLAVKGNRENSLL
jgi:hypothetical protein